MRGIARTILHLVGALLLACAIVSPAVAEIGCSAEAAMHVAGGGADEADHPFLDGDPHDQDQAPEADDHCAFSHGHCGGLTPIVRAEPRFDAAGAPMRPAPPVHFRTRDPAGPDRPPRG